jgi:hypothetical protein
MKLTILHVADCPNVSKLIEHISTATKSVEVQIHEVLVETDEQASALGMLGSPTLLIDGVNQFSPSGSPSLSCALRIPSSEEIASALAVANRPPEHPLRFLVGTWVGSGEGIYPTIPSFRYNERVTMTVSPKGFVAYQQSTSHPDSGAPMHAETGYLRAVGNEVEWVLAQPSGIVEIHHGGVANDPVLGIVVEFAPLLVATTPSAKSVTAIQRSIVVRQNVLTYRVAMAAVGLPLQHHLGATLERVE